MDQFKTSGKPFESKKIILPLEVRQVLGWEEKTRLEIWIDATDHEVVIKKHEVSCMCCGGTIDLKECDKKYICTNCRKKIAEL